MSSVNQWWKSALSVALAVTALGGCHRLRAGRASGPQQAQMQTQGGDVSGGGGWGAAPNAAMAPPVPAVAIVESSADARVSAIRLPASFTPVSSDGALGGDVATRTLGAGAARCRGRVAAGKPDHVLFLDAAQPSLRLAVRADPTALLVVRGPDGSVSCARTEGGALALRDRFEAGRYEVWIGTTRRRGGGTYSLTVAQDSVAQVAQVAPPPPPPQPRVVVVAQVQPQQQQWTAPPPPPPVRPQPVAPPPQLAPPPPVAQQPVYARNDALPTSDFGALRMSSTSAQSMLARGRAGGGASATSIMSANDAACSGFIAQRPGHVLAVEENLASATITARSRYAVSLVVQTPDGQYWCTNADNDASLSGGWNAGTYSVWVASTDRDVVVPYDLVIARNDAQQPVAQPEPQQADPPSELCNTLFTMATFSRMAPDNRVTQLVDDARAGACDRHTLTTPFPTWSNGVTAHYDGSDDWQWPNGATAHYGASSDWQYPNGATAHYGASGDWQWPNGTTARYGASGQWQDPRGTSTTEEVLVDQACTALGNDCSLYIGAVRGATGFYHELAILEMTWAATRH